MKRWFVVPALAVLVLAAGGTDAWSQAKPLAFGVIIWRSPTLTAQFWNPILRYVSEKSGVPLQLKVATTGPEHTMMVRRGELQFLYSNHNFIKDNEKSGYRVFGRPKGDAQSGEIVVLKESPIQSLSELEGKEVVFPHTAAFLGYPLPMDALMRRNVHGKPIFAGNQEGAITLLTAGRTVAAGVNAEVLRAYAAREHLAYRVLWASEKSLNLALSAHPSVAADTVKAVQTAMFGMSDDPERAKVLAAAAEAVKAPPLVFVAAKDSDFDNMRRFYRTTSVKIELQ